MSTSAPALGADLDVLLASRLRRPLRGTVLSTRTARIVLDAPDSGVWTVDIAGGRGQARRGSASDADLVVHGTAGVLAEVVSGRESGVHAFLDGRLTVRGDLSLSLQLDGLFAGLEPGRPEFPRAEQVLAMGVRSSYLEAGPSDGPPVLLLHGLGATNASMLPLLADLAVDHRVIAPDLPGFGATAAPSGPYNPAWFAAWVEAFQTVTGSRRAVLVGNSLGGRIALAAAFPARAKSAETQPDRGDAETLQDRPAIGLEFAQCDARVHDAALFARLSRSCVPPVLRAQASRRFPMAKTQQARSRFPKPVCSATRRASGKPIAA